MSFSKYPEYKESGVDWLGEVPAHWNVRRLSNFFEERREKVSDIDFKPLSVTKNGIVSQLDNVAKTDDHQSRKKVSAGDFVINSRSDRKGSSGMSGTDGSVSLINTVLIPNKGIISPKFAHYLLRSTNFQDEFYRYGKGIVADLWSTHYSEMRCISLSIPPLKEQNFIVYYLEITINSIDILVTEQEKLIDLLKEKRQAVISHAVTKGLDPAAPMKDSGVDWIGEVPAHWDVVPIAYRYDVQLGKMLDTRRITGLNLKPYLRVADVQWGAINTEDLPYMDFDQDDQNRYRLEIGDLLVNEGGSYVGRSAIWNGQVVECYYQKALHRLRPYDRNRDTTYFFYFCMAFAVEIGAFIAGGNQATIEHLTAESLKRYRFAFPPLHEQYQISEALSSQTIQLDSLITEAQTAIALLKERRAALISAAVTGKIDVRGLVAETGGEAAAV